MSKRSEARAKGAEALLAEVERMGQVCASRKGGFSQISLSADGYCRASVTFAGMGNSVTIRGTDARDALTKAYVFHKMHVDGFNDAGRY